MPVGGYFAIAELVLRALDATPKLVGAIESFWRTVTTNPGAPAHVEAAIIAAIEHVKKAGTNTDKAANDV